jgi:hypothetical protein
MRTGLYILISVLLLLAGSCVTQFIPETNEDQEVLVVEGLITDQPGINTVKLSESRPLADKRPVYPYRYCNVTISDDLGNTYDLTEKEPGVYVTDSAEFRGIAGRKYKLTIETNNFNAINHTYESLLMEMKPVPAIDSLYYEKVNIRDSEDYIPLEQGCQVYLDTHDPLGVCKYFRWDYIETWQIGLPFVVPNSTCWITDNSGVINIKNTSVFTQDRIHRYPINYVSNLTDRLNMKYSMLVNQYSLNEDEYVFWERLQNVSEEVGSLYDITPASIPGNIYCLDDPGEQVLGYFSVSAKSSKRIFIDDDFSGLVNLYKNCVTDTVYGEDTEIPGLDVSIWIIGWQNYVQPPYKILTTIKGCADCTVRGSNVKPSWWDEK